MRILITGFEPFLDHQENISEVLAKRFQRQSLFQNSDHHILLLPVEFQRAFDVLNEHLSQQTYDFIFQMGLAANRTKISMERVGLNWVETSQADNAGVIPARGFIDPFSDKALFSTMPWSDIFPLLSEKDVEISFSAGTYVCNDLYFRTLNWIKKSHCLQTHVGFLHLPQPSGVWTVEKIEKTVLQIILSVVSKV